jgi:hypothetical protein
MRSSKRGWGNYPSTLIFLFAIYEAPLLRHQSPEGDGAHCDADGHRLIRDFFGFFTSDNTLLSQPGDAHAAGAKPPRASIKSVIRLENFRHDPIFRSNSDRVLQKKIADRF